ncbi:MAG: efflux RND transporter periplasmic adaptor subunit [Oscillospiraceae bacterium]|nr:efflux RND transporter periplasmic adaptor subunit [Oscillospiraceae bacterium]
MNRKKWLIAALAACMLLVFCGCGEDGTAVYVQSVAELAGMGGIAPDDRFAGIVVSENVAEVNRDSDKTIKELLVKAGDDVEEGQLLFSYDTEQLQLNLDKQRLEKEQLEATIENYKDQIADLEKQRKRVKESAQLQYTVQIQSLQVDLKESELKLKSKEQEVAKSEDVLQNADVKSPVTGRIQEVNENGTDSYGRPVAYITIQQAGSYRIKGTLGELQRGGIMEGSRIRITSRADESAFWLGTVTLVDYENPSQENPNNMYYGVATDEMTASSKYPFYIEVDNTDGLILGQHVYLRLEKEEGEETGIPLSMAFLCYDDDGTAYVWAENNRGKLEKRIVTLGAPNDMMGTVSIVEGLAETDYVAFPDGELCQEGAPTTHEVAAVEEVAVEGGV